MPWNGCTPVPDLGWRVEGWGFWVYGLRFRVDCLGFRVKGLV